MNITIYDPPMCCSSGICGPSVDDTLVRLVENIEHLKRIHPDLTIDRYMITQQPLKFRENETVYQLIKSGGKEVLPITTVNGKIIKDRGYASLEEMETHL